MIKVWYGEKGSGKTKSLISKAEEIAVNKKGDIVFLDRTPDRIFDITHRIRVTNVSDFPVISCCSFIGFISGVISNNYDVTDIFVDGLTHITKEDSENYEKFFATLEKLSEKFDINFYLTFSGPDGKAPEYIKKYL